MTIDSGGYLSGCCARGEPSVVMVACGDIALVRRVEPKLLAQGAEAAWESGLDVFRSADIAVGNLECPVSDGGDPRRKGLGARFRADPGLISFFAESGLTVVSLANNHILDYGSEALLDTTRHLSENGVKFFGAGMSQRSAQEPLIVERNEIKVGFLGYTEWGPFNKDDSPGPARFSETTVFSQVARLKGFVDLIVVSMHFGFEWVSYPSPHHVTCCRRLIESGVNVVLGHHPHQPQGVEMYKGGLIAYSLGNLLFDQFHGNPPPASREILVLRLRLADDGVASAEIVPFRLTENLSLSLLQGKSKARALDRYRDISVVLQSPVALRQEWYNTVRLYLFSYMKALLFGTIRKKDLLYPLRLARSLITHSQTRRLFVDLASFLVSGYCFKAEYQRFRRKLQRKNRNDR